MAGAVDELLAAARLGDDGARRAVDLLAGDVGPHGLEYGLLGGPHDLEHLALLGDGRAHVNGAGRVGAVAIVEAAEVEHDHVAFLDRPLACLVMRVRAGGP
jgi:hypothetical protein